NHRSFLYRESTEENLRQGTIVRTPHRRLPANGPRPGEHWLTRPASSCLYPRELYLRATFITSDARNNTRKMKNRIFAIPAAATAMPANPKIPATIAMRRKQSVQYSMMISSFRCELLSDCAVQVSFRRVLRNCAEW